MNCAGCGLENPPVQDGCAFCGGPLEHEPGARARWEALGPALREEFSRTFDRALAGRKDWAERLRRLRRRSALAGAALNAAVLGFAHGIASLEARGGGLLLVFLALDAAAGAGLGYAVNRGGGGEYRGMVLFGAWYLVSTLLKLGAGVLAVGPLFGFFVVPGLLVALAAGAVFGLNLSLKRSIEL